MRKVLVVALIGLLSLGSALHATAQGKLIVDRITSPSLEGNLVGDPATRSMYVYLPPSYETSNNRYPVIYVLHWYTGDYTTFAQDARNAADSLIKQGKMQEVILVCPDGSNRFRGSMYANSVAIGNYEDYIAKDLVSYIDGKYRTIPSRNSRALTGVSMGAYGSFRFGFLHPDMFGVLYGHAGGLYDFASAETIIRNYANRIPKDLSAFNALPSWRDQVYFAAAAAFTPNPSKPPLYFDFPFEVINGQIIRQEDVWQKYLGSDAIHLIDDYTGQPLRLRFIGFDHGTTDTAADISYARNLHAALLESNVPHLYLEHSGGHIERFSVSFPYLSQHLASELLPEDTVAPARVTDLKATDIEPTSDGIGYGSLTLQWTAPGDDTNVGQAHHYDIRYSREPITNRNNFAVPELAEIPEPARAGQRQSIILNSLEPGTHYFSLIAYDELHSASPLSNVLKVDIPANLLSDVTARMQIEGGRKDTQGSLAICLDQDMDGRTDLYVASETVFLNRDSDRFEPLGSNWDLTDSRAEMAATADYDNDGWPDLLTTRSGRLQLYRNQGRFYTEEAEKAGLLLDLEPEWMTFVDLDRDNWLDLYIDVRRAPSRVYLNQGDGTFRESSSVLGLDIDPPASSVLFADLNGDNRVDAYPPGDFPYTQAENGRFMVDPSLGIAPDRDLRDACLGDYDNDGDLDLYVAGSGRNTLYRKDGGRFEDVTGEMGMVDEAKSVSAHFVDIDNDGCLDLYVVNRGTSDVLYIQNAEGRFKVRRDPETTALSQPRSAAFADFDGDGDVDIYIAQSGGEAGRLLRNNAEDNHWLHLQLTGTLSNPDALGAQVFVTTPDGVQMRTVSAQTGWCSDSLPVEFGLGTHSQADTVDIRWPSGQWQILRDVSADQVLTVTENDQLWGTSWGDIRRTALLPNYPNPFNPETWIPYQLAVPADVRILIHDALGHRVRELALGIQQAGDYTRREQAAYWDGRNSAGEPVASGVYLVSLRAGAFRATRKMVVMR